VNCWRRESPVSQLFQRRLRLCLCLFEVGSFAYHEEGSFIGSKDKDFAHDGIYSGHNYRNLNYFLAASPDVR
jgi:hypothetical protein